MNPFKNISYSDRRITYKRLDFALKARQGAMNFNFTKIVFGNRYTIFITAKDTFDINRLRNF